MKINDVYFLAKKGHEGQFRKDNITPYINHPISVCNKLYELGFTSINPFFPTLNLDIELNQEEYTYYAIALMHDLLEDTNITSQEINDTANNYICRCVELLTCFKNEENPFYKMNYMKNIVDFDNMFVFDIKCIDRICNVYDFMKTDRKYAKIYFHKADILWSSLYEKRHMERYKKLWNKVLELNKKVIR